MNGDWTIRTISFSHDWDAALTLLRSVYVDEGFTEPHLADQTFVRNLIEGEGEFLAAVDCDGTILGAVLLPNQQSALRQIARTDVHGREWRCAWRRHGSKRSRTPTWRFQP